MKFPGKEKSSLCNGCNFQLCLFRTETEGSCVPFFGFHLENTDFLTAEILDNFQGNFPSFHYRSSYFYCRSILIRDKKRLYLDGGSHFGVLVIHLDNIPDFYCELVSSDFYDRKHEMKNKKIIIYMGNILISWKKQSLFFRFWSPILYNGWGWGILSSSLRSEERLVTKSQIVGLFPDSPVHGIIGVTTVSNSLFSIMVGDEGFEPPNGGVKVRCLTAWRIPKKRRFQKLFESPFYF